MPAFIPLSCPRCGCLSCICPKIREAVEHPKHYNSHPSGVECLTIARHHNFAVGSIFKYLWRAGLKEGASDIEDLKKARFYLNDEIARLEAK